MKRTRQRSNTEKKIFNNVTVKFLTISKRSISGRNNSGRITVFHRGGGSKKRYRCIDFDKIIGVPGVIRQITYDPNRSSFISLVCYQNNVLSYNLACKNTIVGDFVYSNQNNPISVDIGNTMRMSFVSPGIFINSISLNIKKAIFVRAAGVKSQILQHRSDGYSVVELPSGEQRLVKSSSYCTIGEISNVNHSSVSKVAAGVSRRLGRRPIVRGLAMNPIDHPHGGGDTKGRQPCSPWGLLSKGFKTVKKKSPLILKSKVFKLLMRAKWKVPFFDFNFFFDSNISKSFNIVNGYSRIPFFFNGKRIYLHNGYKNDSFVIKNNYPNTFFKFIDFIPTKKTSFKIHKREFKKKKTKKVYLLFFYLIVKYFMAQTSSNYFRLGVFKSWTIRTFDDKTLKSADFIRFIKRFFFINHRFFRKIGLSINSIVLSENTIELYLYWANFISYRLYFFPRCVVENLLNKFFETRLFIKTSKKVIVKCRIVDTPSAFSILAYFRILTRLRHPGKLNKRIIPKLRNFKNLFGFRAIFSGRFSRDQLAVREIFKFGSIPTSTLDKNVDYAFETIQLRNSLCGIKVWTYFKYKNVRKRNIN